MTESVEPMTITIDSSSFEWVQNCLRGAEIYILKRLEPAVTSPALVYGKAIHAGLHCRYLRQPDINAIKAIRDVYAQPDVDLRDDWRTITQAIQLYQTYCDHWNGECWNVARMKDVPFAEIPFALPLGTVNRVNGSKATVVWTGKIDLVLENGYDGNPVVMDHKTCSVFGGTYFDNFRKSDQMIGYTWAASELLGRRVVGTKVNVLVSRRPTPKGEPFAFHRDVFLYDDDDITEWKHNVLTHLELWQRCVDLGTFPKFRKHCVNKYGRCAYFEVCQLKDSQADSLLRTSLYKPVTWSPFSE